ncbi:Protein of unknown function [Streptomyces sp. DvalAA-14]|uniref:DUF2795 domain-containing protein n=1 Tax=unclassified Streptomyces TaxID=2593676 RepID=UPI00081B7694|nr:MULTISPECIES: DUF2795 domain-containing protein [unclassified Streptomyces]MYS24888.1 DUF2795 domain-containing protein [Streptomyces sp. SID4948]SCE50280.1 Protein of unknown function [Streptomyces sp. DvalAA-14]
MTDQGTNKTGFVRDDELKREMQGELKANREVRIEEAYEPEPSGEDEPITESFPSGDPGLPAPSGMTAEGVTVRTDLARHLERAIYPAKRSALLGSLQRHHAPDTLVDRVSSLPAEPAYPNVQAVVRALGFGVEDRRD